MSKIDMSTWTEAQRAEYASRAAAIEAAKSKAEIAKAKREADRMSPESVLAAQLAEQEAEERAAAAEERAIVLAASERLADAAYRKATAKYGEGRVARIYTDEGSVILKPSTQLEFDELGDRLKALEEPLERAKVMRESLADVVLYPERDVFTALVEKWPGLWPSLFGARDAISDCERARIEKKG